MSKYFSYRQRTEEKRNTKYAFLFILLTLCAITAVIFLGIPTLVRFASILTNVNKSNQSPDSKDNIAPPPPSINTVPEEVNSAKFEIKGNSEPGATVKIYINNETDEIVVDNNGKFLTNVNLNEGENSFYAISIDQSGNQSQKTPVFKIVFDKTNPDIEISKPNDGDQFYGTKQKQITISGKTELGASLSINDRFVLVKDDGSFNYNVILSDGENNFRINSTDKAGNSSEECFKVYYNP